MSVLPYPSPFNPNLQYPNQIATELNNANQDFTTIDNQLTTINNDITTINNNITTINNDITSLNNNKANIDLSNVPQNVFKPIAGFSSVIDLTNATSDYMLQIGEVARIDFSDSLSIPLHIATQSGTCYNFWLIPSNPIDANIWYNWYNANNWSHADIFLNPNNSVYSNAFRSANIYMGASGFSNGYYTYSGYALGSIYASAFGVIINHTKYKHVKVYSDKYGSGANQYVQNWLFWWIWHLNASNFAYASIHILSSNWVDTTTEWTSLGTITTTTYPISGTILVQRIF